MTAPALVPIDDTAQEQANAPTPAVPPDAKAPAKPVTRGRLLEWPEERAAKEALRLWQLNGWQSKLQAGQNVRCGKWRDGERFVKLVTDRANGQVKVTTPVGLDTLPSVPNKVQEKVNNVIATVMADPPRPDAEPAADSPEARDAAQFATRFLLAMSGESGLNLDGVMFSALDIAGTYATGFVEVCYDQFGGGYVPLTVKARPSAIDLATAETGARPDGALDLGPWVTKYVAMDGTLSDSPAGARMTWQAGLRTDLLTSDQVRFLPRFVSGTKDADGVVIGRFVPLGRLKRAYPRVQRMSVDELRELEQWAVPDAKRILPKDYERNGGRRDGAARGDDEDTGPDDETLICTLTVYYRSHPAYPKGCAAVFGGGKYRLHADVLYFENPDGLPETMDLPLAAMTWEIDEAGKNPYGKTPVTRLGPLDEMRTSIFVAMQEYLDRFSRPRPLFPMGTIVQPEDWADWDKPIQFNPNGKPEMVQLPDFPQMGPQMLDRIDAEMEAIAGVAGPAMGQVAGSVRSADQQNTLIERATIAITQLRNNAQDFYERLCRLVLQGARRHFDVPQLMTYRGESGAYQVAEFTRADFGTTKQVKVQRGTFTMLTPTQKNEVIGMEVQMGGLAPEEAARLRRENISALIGLQDSVHVTRVKRQLHTWRQGVPGGLPEPTPQLDPMGQPVLDPMTGQPVMVDPVAQAAQQVFPVLPVDQEQAVALQRHQELAKAVAELDFYAHFPPAWTQALVLAYEQARQAAGIATIAEQQMAAQQQQQQEAEARETAQGAKREEQRENRAAKREDGERQRQHQQQMQTQKDQATLEREQAALAARAAGAP